MRGWTIGKDVPFRLPLSLATFNSVTTRSYAIISVCMCGERFGTIISQFQTSAIIRVPELTAGVLLPTTDPLISESIHCTVSASNTTAQFIKDVFFLCFPIVLTASFQETIVSPPTFFYSYCKMRFCSCAMRTRCGRSLCLGV